MCLPNPPDSQQGPEEDQVPVLLCKTSYTGCETPEHQADDQEHLSVPVVCNEPSEDACEDIDGVEDGPCHHLVLEATAIPPPAAGMIAIVVVAEATNSEAEFAIIPACV